jgi:hypothetical protein
MGCLVLALVSAKGYDGGRNSLQLPTLGQLLPALIGISLMIGITSGYIVSIRTSRNRARRDYQTIPGEKQRSVKLELC